MAGTESFLLPLDGKLVDDLYCEAMVLADEARAYLERDASVEREMLALEDRVHFSCESLKITTRLMQVIAWLLSRRAYARGEISLEECRSDRYRLGDAAPSDQNCTRAFPAEMRVLIAASESLYARALRLEEQFVDDRHGIPTQGLSPARDLMRMLETAF